VQQCAAAAAQSLAVHPLLHLLLLLLLLQLVWDPDHFLPAPLLLLLLTHPAAASCLQ
jgi:hypothetical protein